MTIKTTGVGNSTAQHSENVAADKTVNSSSNQSTETGEVSKAVLEVWNKLSASLVRDPESHWQVALRNADELSREVCGKDLPADLRRDLLLNLKLLEQTLSKLRISPTSDIPDPQACIKNHMAVMKLNVVTDADDMKKFANLKAGSAS